MTIDLCLIILSFFQPNSANYPNAFPVIPPSLMSPDYPSDVLPSELFTSLGMIQPVNPTTPCSQR